MRIGLIARADNTGLGIQSWEFYKHIKPHKTIVIDISHLKGMPHYASERYPNCKVVKDCIGIGELEDFLRGLDILFTIETPYSHYVIKRAKECGVITILEYNYEFLNEMNGQLPLPDVLLSPTVWHFEDVKRVLGKRCIVHHIPVPVNRKLCKFKRHTKAKKFLHIIGIKAMEDRNGTEILEKAIPLVKSDVEFIFKTQSYIPKISDPRVRIDKEVHNYWELYDEGDVLVLPRRFGGLCLPLNEAMSCGLVPIMPDISPQNTFLHKDTLIPVCGSKKIMTANEIDCYDVNPKVLAEKIDEFANKDIGYLSDFSNEYAESISWEREQYTNFFRNLLYGKFFR